MALSREWATMGSTSEDKQLRVGDHGQHITSSGVIRARVGCTGVDVEAHSGAKMRTRVPLQRGADVR